MKLATILFFSLFALPAIAQTDLPEIGKLSDLSGKTKVYVSADASHLSHMLKEIDKQKHFTRVTKPEEAEFFIEYKTLTQRPVTSLKMQLETGQLDAYYMRDGKKVIAWSESEASTKRPAVILLKKFLKSAKPK